MPRRKTPQEKKRESYDFDRRSTDEYPHATRRQRPQAKSLAKRSFRRKSNELVRVPEKLDEDSSATVHRLVRQVAWQRHGAPLAKHVDWTLEKRTLRFGWNCFKRPYSLKGRVQFRRIAITLIKGQTEKSAEIAGFFHDIMHG